MELLFRAYSHGTAPVPLDRPLETCTSTPSRTKLLDLPMEIVESIVQNLETPDLCQLQLSCQAFRKYLMPRFWSRIHVGAGAVDKSYPRLTPARYSTRDTSKRYLCISTPQLREFCEAVLSGACDEGLRHVETLTVDLQFYVTKPKTEPKTLQDVANASLTDLVHFLVSTLIPCRLNVNLKLLEVRSLAGPCSGTELGLGKPVVNTFMKQGQFRNIPVNFELSSSDMCISPPALYLDNVKYFRLMLDREYTGFDLVTSHFEGSQLHGPNVEQFELVYHYFNNIAVVDGSDLKEFFAFTKKVKKLVFENILIRNNTNWLPTSVEDLNLTGCTETIPTALNITRLSMGPYCTPGFFQNASFPLLEELIIAGPATTEMTVIPLLRSSPRMRKIHFKEFTLSSIAKTLAFTSKIDTLIIDEPDFLVEPELDNEHPNDPGQAVLHISQIARQIKGKTRNLVIDLERLTKQQFVQAIFHLSKGNPQLRQLYVKVLLKRPHRAYLHETNVDFLYDECCQVDLVSFWKVYHAVL